MEKIFFLNKKIKIVALKCVLLFKKKHTLKEEVCNNVCDYPVLYTLFETGALLYLER